MGRSPYADYIRLSPPRYTASAIRRFCREIGVAKADSMVEVELLQHYPEELNKTARRGMAVLKPLKVVSKTGPRAC
ncbi:MAG: hypothetical protein ACLUEQ_10330 [Cloacibacillus evryensis]